MNARDQLIDTLKVALNANLLKHKMNVEIMLNNPTAIHDHTDWMGAVERELAVMAEYHDKIEVIERYFK